MEDKAIRRERVEADLRAWEVREAMLDIAFTLAQTMGVIWLVRRVPFLRLKQWAQDREDGRIS